MEYSKKEREQLEAMVAKALDNKFDAKTWINKFRCIWVEHEFKPLSPYHIANSLIEGDMVEVLLLSKSFAIAYAGKVNVCSSCEKSFKSAPCGISGHGLVTWRYILYLNDVANADDRFKKAYSYYRGKNK